MNFDGNSLGTLVERRLDDDQANRTVPRYLWPLTWIAGAAHREPRRRKELKTTLTEDRLMASAAIMGDKSQPVKG